VISQYLHTITEDSQDLSGGSELKVETESPKLYLLLVSSLARLRAWGLEMF
jgi:hypothetical protein